MKEPKVHPYIGCTFGGIEVFRAARACAVSFLLSGTLHSLLCFPVGYFCGNSEQSNHPVKVLLLFLLFDLHASGPASLLFIL